MRMLVLPFVIQYLTLFHVTASDKDVEIKFIVEYLQKQDSKMTISAYLCWNIEYLKKLTKDLNQNGNIINIGEVRSDDERLPKFMNHMQITDLSCNNSKDFLRFVNKGFNFRDPNHWLIFDNSHHDHLSTIGYNHDDIFHELNILIDTRVILVERHNMNFILKYIFKMNSKSEIMHDEFAIWDYNRGFIKYENDCLSWRRHNIKQYPIRVSMLVLDNSTLDHLDDYRYNEIDALTKMNYIPTETIMQYMNATKVLKIYSVYYNYRGGDHNGTAMGSIIYGEADISGSPFFCRPERLPWMDCIAMTTPGRTYFYFRQPPLSYVKNIYALPFGKELWLIDISFLMLSSILLYIIVIWEWKVINENENENNVELDMIHKNFSDAILFVMGAVCQQGYATEPKGTSGKILILTIFFTLIFLFTAYAAYTVVLFQETADDIKSLNDLYKSNMKLGVDDKPYYKQLVAAHTEPLRKKIYEEKIHPKGQSGNYYPLKEGMAKMRNEYFAFFVDDINGNRIIQNTFLESEKCGLEQLTYLFVTSPWIIAPKNSPFKEIFTMGYRKLYDTGLLKREIKKRMADKPKCNNQKNNFRSAGLLDLYPVYMILIIGISSSVAILIMEIITSKILDRDRSRITDNIW